MTEEEKRLEGLGTQQQAQSQQTQQSQQQTVQPQEQNAQAQQTAQTKPLTQAQQQAMNSWGELAPKQYQFGTAATDEAWLKEHGAMSGVANGGSGDVAGDTDSAEASGAGAGGAQTQDGSADPYAVTDEMRRKATEGIDHKIKTTQDWLNSLEAPETKEQREERERKEKNRKKIMAISDGLRSLSNLFFTSRYAPNMYDSRRNQTDRIAAEQDKEAQKRDKNNADYLKYSLSLGDLERDKEKALQDLDDLMAKRREAAAEAARKEKDDKFNEEMHPLELDEQKNKAARAQYQANEAEVKAKNAPKKAELENKEIESKIGANKAKAHHYVTMDGDKMFHFLGQTYGNENDYVKAVTKELEIFNKEHPENPIYSVESFTTGRGTEDRLIAANRLAGMIEARYEEEKKKYRGYIPGGSKGQKSKKKEKGESAENDGIIDFSKENE